MNQKLEQLKKNFNAICLNYHYLNDLLCFEKQSVSNNDMDTAIIMRQLQMIKFKQLGEKLENLSNEIDNLGKLPSYVSDINLN